MRILIAVFVVGLLCGSVAAQEGDWQQLFNGKDLTGWKLRDGKENKTWKIGSKVEVDPANAKKLIVSGKGGTADAVVVRQELAEGVDGIDLLSEKEFGDVELEIEFMVPKEGNTGIFFMGRYELQACESHGIPDAKMEGECGSIMWTKGPKTNATKPAGQWQKYHVIFRAPRFDAAGKKTENAKFVSVTLNGTKVQENTDVPEPTGSGLEEPEKATGPLMLQGNEGLGAFRNVRIRSIR